MGQASLSANALESATGLPRFRIPERAFDLADPIKKVDEAVRAVLAELNGPSRVSKGVRLPGLSSDRLFSLRHAEALPPGTRIVQVGPGTVVTPLARDLLKRQGITIRLVASRANRWASARGEWGFAIEADGGARDDRRRCGGPCSRTRVPGSSSSPRSSPSASWLRGRDGSRGHADHGRGGARGLEVVPGCRASGRRRPRSPAEVDRAVQSLGMNLLVVEPAGQVDLLDQAARRRPSGSAGRPGCPRP